MMTPPKLGRALAEAIAGARYIELDGAGHFLMTERPKEIARLLLGSLGGTDLEIEAASLETAFIQLTRTGGAS